MPEEGDLLKVLKSSNLKTYQQEKVIGVLDMDCPVLNGFSKTDQRFCEEIVKKLIQKTDFGKIRKFYDLE